MAKETKQGEQTAAVTPMTMVVNVDTISADVLRWNDEGKELTFEDSVEGFKQLTDGEVSKLSILNKARHRVAYALYRLNCEERDNPSPTDGLSSNGRITAPRSRCYIYPETKNPAYRYSCIAPEDLYRAQRNGAEVVTRKTDPDLKFSGGTIDDDGMVKIGVPGKTELIAVRYPKELYRKNVELPPAITSQKLNLTYEEVEAQRMKEKGGLAFTSGEHTDKKFTEVNKK